MIIFNSHSKENNNTIDEYWVDDTTNNDWVNDTTDDNWIDKSLKEQINNCFLTMLQAAQKPNAFINTKRNLFYTGAAKLTIRNKNRQMKLAVQGSKKIDSYFHNTVQKTD
ncbi:5431_t:CDS:2, partial [Racocetra fulgida]